MIAFRHLGRLGRFGNQLFQIASTIGIGATYNRRVFFNDLKSTIFKNALPSAPAESDHWPTVHMPIKYIDAPLGRYKTSPAVQLYGFMQSEKYFSHVADYVRIQLETNDELDPLNKLFCSIHIRLGDYLHKGPANVYLHLGGSYYMQAIEYMMKHGYERFLIFSDDIPHARRLWESWRIEHHIDAEFTFRDERVSTIDSDFLLMKQCGAHIIANSTFSWWTAWLSNEPLVITPRKWFVPGTYDSTDVVPKRWVAI